MLKQRRKPARWLVGHRHPVSYDVPGQAPTGMAPRPASNNPLHPRNWPFRLKLALVTILLAVVPTLLATTLLVRHADGLAENRQATASRQEAGAVAATIGNIIGVAVTEVDGLAGARSIVRIATHPGPGDSSDFGPLAPGSLSTLSSGRLEPGSLYVVAKSGRIVDATNRALIGNSSRFIRSLVAAVVGKKSSAVLGGAVDKQAGALVIAAPILQGSTVVGALLGEFDSSALYAVLSSANATLVANDGRIITGHRMALSRPVQLLGAAKPVSSAQALAALNSDQPLSLVDGSAAARVLPGARVVVRTAMVPPLETTLDNPWIESLFILIIVFAVALALWVTVEVTGPLSDVARTLKLVRAGNFGVRTSVRQRDEIGQIASTVDMLIARTQALVASLDGQRMELETGIIQLFTELAEAANGNLTIRPTLSEGSLGAVADSVRILLEQFTSTVKRIQSTAVAVSTDTSEMATTIAKVSQETQKQSAQLTEGAAAITEMAASAESVSERTNAATAVASQAVDAVESGNRAVTFARDAVKRTSETSKKAARQVKNLGESAQLMGNALLLVQRNTEELHLIAGNASIEAARYAENGGVFRTVADSIEQLAEQSQVALRQIQNVVENTQRETSRVVAAIEDVTNEVSTVAKAVNVAGENFDTINHVVQRLADLNGFIASASGQQAAMAAEIAAMIGALNQVSARTSQHTAASAEAAIRLQQLTAQLNDSVATLKVS